MGRSCVNGTHGLLHPLPMHCFRAAWRGHNNRRPTNTHVASPPARPHLHRLPE
jgi:hypothetical protein